MVLAFAGDSTITKFFDIFLYLRELKGVKLITLLSHY
jgi:hypothetical protein